MENDTLTSDNESTEIRNYWSFIFLGVLALGLFFRVYAATFELWLDEIWSVKNVRASSTPLEAFLLRIDNNHPLNSLFIYFTADSPFLLRLFSLSCGLLSLVVAFNFKKLWGRFSAEVLTISLSISFLMVLYSTEVRGYVPMIFGSLCAHYMLEKLRAQMTWKTIALLWPRA